MYKVFHRKWWRKNPSWPGGLEPHPGPKHEICKCETEEEARQECEIYNNNHRPGKYSDKAEYEKI